MQDRTQTVSLELQPAVMRPDIMAAETIQNMKCDVQKVLGQYFELAGDVEIQVYISESGSAMLIITGQVRF